MAEFRLETERLVLREWREEDRDSFWEMAQDPEVMRYLPATTRDEMDAAVGRLQAAQAEHGLSLWALETKDPDRFIGFCGFMPPRAPLEEFEIGWRLERDAWGKGFAREAAQACLEWMWRECQEKTVVAITVPANKRSWGLMRRIGMHYVEGGDFDHPDLPEGSPLRRHVLYRIDRPG